MRSRDKILMKHVNEQMKEQIDKKESRLKEIYYQFQDIKSNVSSDLDYIIQEGLFDDIIIDDVSEVTIIL